ncbi:MAG: SMR family transporter [Oricola sp.]
MNAIPKYTYLLLGAAILAEVVATTALARTESFTRLVPSIITIAGYALAFWLLSYPVRVMPTGIVYAIWSGAGIVLVTGATWAFFGQRLDLPAIVGMALIIAGVVIVNVFSKTVVH